MAESLPKTWDPSRVEKYWRDYWRENGVFTPNPDKGGEPFSIVIPPPNVTGALHIGHALNLSLIDTLCRHARQLGKNVLWIPGTDHAGISTQNVVEKSLAKEGLGRKDLGRDKFVERVWKWREDFGHRILGQIDSLGCSVDWSRLRFTMDEGMSRTVRRVFVQLWEEGLIYRGNYIINWCRRCHTALADDEVEYASEAGRLWKIRYPFTDGSGFVVVATTRPETIPGDTAVCVHPEDERYQSAIGKKVFVPVLGRAVPVIADRYVERDFGTGVLKVTPSHHHNDWQLGHKHKLEFIQVIDENGLMKAEAGPYAGMSIADCREAILKDIAEAGQLEGEEALQHAVGRCYRCNTVVEPHVSKQWFVAATKLAPAARAAVPEPTRLLPTTWLKTWEHWLDNIRDWCISRQIWWGHRIPAWTCQQCGKLVVAMESPEKCPECGSVLLVQEEDVLDTWFSSALWPFSTLGWPEITRDLKFWYPTTSLVTGFDILFFWVARMMMMGIHFMGQPPFGLIYLHALVRDSQGRKMSKSLGNGIDPVDMIQKYGCDALRFTLVSMVALGRDIRLSEDKIENSRHFVNKLWNASRFALMNLGDERPKPLNLSGLSSLAQIWILDRLEGAKLDIAGALAGYRFNDAAMCGYHFLWDDFCDWFLELVKPELSSEVNSEKEAARYVLWLVLRETLLLLYPIMPFVTAEVWKALPHSEEEGDDIALLPYPASRPDCSRPERAREMEFIKNTIIAIRTIRSELSINPARKISAIIQPASAEQKNLLENWQKYVFLLAKLDSLVIAADAVVPEASASQVVEGALVAVPLAGAVNIADELARMEKELAKIEKELSAVNMKLHNESFMGRAPADVIEREKARAAKMADARSKLIHRQKLFSSAMNQE